MYKFLTGKKVYETHEVDSIVTPLQEAAVHIQEAFDLASAANSKAEATKTTANKTAEDLENYANTNDARIISIDQSIADIANIASIADSKADSSMVRAATYGIKCFVTKAAMPTSTSVGGAVTGLAITLDDLKVYTSDVASTGRVTWTAIGKLSAL